ncbi:MAG: RNA polymerase sigma factor [Chitinophagales bacterium]
MNDLANAGIFMSEQQTTIINNAVKQERGRLLKFIRSKVRNEEDAEDILQDVFYQLASNHGIVDTIENMAAWLFRVARNRIIDVYRKRKPESIDTNAVYDEEEDGRYFFQLAKLSSSENDEPDAQYERSLVWETLTQALNELPEEQRDVFILHELENKSFQEIVEITGAPLNTLLSRKRYAVIHLRERMQGLYDDFFNE